MLRSKNDKGETPNLQKCQKARTITKTESQRIVLTLRTLMKRTMNSRKKSSKLIMMKRIKIKFHSLRMMKSKGQMILQMRRSWFEQGKYLSIGIRIMIMWDIQSREKKWEECKQMMKLKSFWDDRRILNGGKKLLMNWTTRKFDCPKLIWTWFKELEKVNMLMDLLIHMKRITG